MGTRQKRHHPPTPTRQGFTARRVPQPVNPGQATVTIVTIAHLANLAAGIFHTLAPLTYHQRFRVGAATLLGLETADTDTLLASLDIEVAKAALCFDLAIHPVRPVAEIIQEANIRLNLLHLDYQEMHRELARTNAELERLRQQLETRGRQLETLANIDGLTGICNHRCFQNFLQAEIARAVANDGMLSLLLIDIDHFKQFNDAHGHQAGDFILKELANVARTGIRTYDMLARYGGEEFAVVLPDTDSEGAMTVAERMRGLIAGHDFANNAHHYRVTMSIGAASLAPADADRDRNRLIALADQALYRAKKQGRNRVNQYVSRSRHPLPLE